MKELSHLDEKGQARMVDVTAKAPTLRRAVARGKVLMRPETAALIQERGIPKGNVLATARVTVDGGGIVIWELLREIREFPNGVHGRHHPHQNAAFYGMTAGMMTS